MPTPQMPGASRQVRYLIAGAAIVVLGVIVLTGWMLLDSRKIARDAAIASAANLSSAFAHDIRRNIEIYDLSLKTVIEALKLPDIWSLRPELRNRILFDGSTSATDLGAILVMDEQGKLITASRGDPEGDYSFANRDYFQMHQTHRDLGLYVSPPFKGEYSATWSIALSRRIEHPDHSFAGIVVGVMRLTYFQHLFDAINFGPTGTVTLLRTDGTVVLRKPYDEQDIGRSLKDLGLSKVVPLSRADEYEGVSTINGVNRLFAYKQVGDLPLIVSVGASEDVALAEWRRKALIVSISVAGLIAVAGLLGRRSLIELKRRNRAEQMVAESERRYRLLADNSTDAIVVADVSGMLLYVSPACRTLYGYEPEELVGRAMTEGVHPNDVNQVTLCMTRILAGEDPVMTVSRKLRKDGTYIWTEGNARLVTDPATGNPTILSVVRDISERKATEEALERARDQAEAGSRAKSKFLANMSHELRTPLNAVIGFSEIIERATFGPLGNERYREYATDIRESGQHLLDMINDVLDHAKAEADHLTLDEDTVDIGGVIDFAVRMLIPRADRAGIALTTFVAPGISVRGDERRLRQIMLNLLTNAIKFTPAEGRIAVTASFANGGDLVLAVEDNGIGIAEEDQVRIFEPFHGVRPSDSNQEGTGLGLPLTKRLVELHGGVLELRSTLGAGTTMRIRIPASRVIAPEPITLAPPWRHAVALIVDDDAEIRTMAVTVLEGMGFMVLPAAGANEALAHLQRQPKIDLLFTDIVIPSGMNGIELAGRASALRPAIKILLANGLAGYATPDNGGCGPRHAVLAKPYGVEELELQVANLFGALRNIVSPNEEACPRDIFA